MTDYSVVREFLRIVVRQRIALLAALDKDKRSPDLQRKIADFYVGRGQPGEDENSGSAFPVGETLELLAAIRPREGYGEFQTAFQQAIAAVRESNDAGVILPKIESVRDVHLAMFEEVQFAFKQSIIRPESMSKHGKIVSDFWEYIRFDPPAAVALGIDNKVKPEIARKKSTASGEAAAKLIAALTLHHQYDGTGCLIQEPVGNNKLSRLAEVSTGTASHFFVVKFGGHNKYKAICRDLSRLLHAMQMLNGDLPPRILYKSPDSDL